MRGIIWGWIQEWRDKKSPGDVLLSHGLNRSIIDVGGLNFRVRNGIGCGTPAMVTRTNIDHIGDGK